MISLIIAIIVNLTVGTSTDLPTTQDPNTGKTTDKQAPKTEKGSAPSLGTMGGTGQWAEG